MRDAGSGVRDAGLLGPQDYSRLDAPGTARGEVRGNRADHDHHDHAAAGKRLNTLLVTR